MAEVSALADVERDGRIANAFVGEAHAIRNFDAEAVEALGAAEGDHSDGSGEEGGEFGQAAEPGAGKATKQDALAERRGDGPV